MRDLTKALDTDMELKTERVEDLKAEPFIPTIEFLCH